MDPGSFARIISIFGNLHRLFPSRHLRSEGSSRGVALNRAFP
jgi:hypothetical protein